MSVENFDQIGANAAGGRYTMVELLEAYEAGREAGRAQAELALLPARDPRIKEIQAAVCAQFAIRMTDMVSARRGRDVARPRQVAMYLCREITPHSLPAIGRHFGGRDHTTVMHAIDTVKKLATADPDFGARVVEIRQHLTGGVEHGKDRRPEFSQGS